MCVKKMFLEIGELIEGDYGSQFLKMVFSDFFIFFEVGLVL